MTEINIGASTTAGPIHLDLHALLATRALVQGSSGAGKSWLLRVLYRAGRSGLTRQQLADGASMAIGGGTFRTYLSKLRTLELVRETGGRLYASEVFWG